MAYFMKSPLILPGQVYLNEQLDEYIVVTRTNRGQIFFRGVGIHGSAEDQEFVDYYPPVDPEDLTGIERGELEGLVEGLELLVGFVPAEEEEV